MREKLWNPVIVFVLGFCTFGLSNLIYLYKISERIGKNPAGERIYPMREAVLNVITFGVYGIIWSYRTAKALYGEAKNAIICAFLSAIPMLRSVSMSMIAGQM